MSEVTPMRSAILCRYCRRELQTEVANKGGGKVKLVLKCPKHGSLMRGERFYTGYTTAGAQHGSS